MPSTHDAFRVHQSHCPPPSLFRLQGRAFWKRLAGICVGLGTQLLFAVTVWFLFWFLRDCAGTGRSHAVWIDGALAVQYAVIHSLLLWPRVRERLLLWIGPAFYGNFFCIVTCVTLLAVISGWRTIPGTVWNLHGPAATIMQGAFYTSWALLFYSLWLSGLGYQTGWTPWWHWYLGERPPRRDFQPRSLYRWLRHPIYLSFLGLIWFTPRMSYDHLLLTGIWTAYIFLGSYFKDERLAYYLKETYREYQRRVPGYPFIPFSPLGRLRSSVVAADSGETVESGHASRQAA